MPTYNKIEMGVSAKDNLSKTGDTKVFKVKIGDALSVKLQGREGEDFDLYLKRDSLPTTENYDARGYTASAIEKVVIHPVQPGDYIMVRSYYGSGDFEIKVDLEE